MDFLKKISSTIEKYSMLSAGDTVLIGLSGGPDSVCLLSALSKLRASLGLRLYAVYVNHGLRPLEAEAETAFSRDLAGAMAVEFFVRQADVKTYSKEHGMNKQEAGRQLRYRIFEELAYKIKADKIAVGHTLDDQIETFFMHLLRGSSALGLSAIPPRRGNVIRPLIEVQRKDIEKFLNEERLNYMVDSSNLNTDYLRNRLRLSLIPALKEMNPNITETISKTAEILREEDRYLEMAVTKAMMRLITRKTDKAIELFLAPLEAMDKVILRRVIRRALSETKGLRGVGFTHIEDILKLIKNGKAGDRVYLPKGIRAIKQYSMVLLTSEPPQRLSTYTLMPDGEVIVKEAGVLIRADIRECLEVQGDEKTTAVMDADKVSFPLIIRPRKHGDFFYPYGFGRRKKIQDFFVDEKVPRDERDRVPIITSGDDVICIAGMRQDDRFKATQKTKRILVIEVKQLR